MGRFIMMLSVLCIILAGASFTVADKPCSPRKYNHSSIVCVCNADYCDEISKIKPAPAGKYIIYTSTLDGQRFNRSEGDMKKSEHKSNGTSNTDLNNIWQLKENEQIIKANVTIKIDREIKYQDILGFGGAFTDSAGINMKSLSEKTRRNLLQSYFSEEGLEYNMGRVPIGGSDFSPRPYTYNMNPENDTNLSNYSLTEEDFIYKIPFIKEALNITNNTLLLKAASWSPPIWMKSNRDYGGECTLLPQYYQTWAVYHLKFLELYAENGINFWGISTGNEPMNGVIPIIAFNSLGWIATEQAQWVVNNFGPLIRKSPFSKIKILAMDDQRTSLPWWMQYMSTVDNALDYIDGIATHYYYDEVTSPINIDRTREMFSDMFFISTEACTGNKPWLKEKVQLGSWKRAETYIIDIIEVLNHHYVGWIDWNLALNSQGGPNWFKNFVDSTVIVLSETDEFLKQPTYYAIGHFSKFVPRGSTRVSAQTVSLIDNVALLRPDGGIVIVICNMANEELLLRIEEEEKGTFDVKMPARSIQTIMYW